MGLISLVYVSYEQYKLSDDELKDILTQSRTQNTARNITGMLLYRDGFFIQALEGEKDVVTEVYQNIKLDKRHRDPIIVYETPIEERSFTSWAMGFNKITDTSLQALEGFTDFMTNRMNSAFFSENPSRAKTLLELFRDRSFF